MKKQYLQQSLCDMNTVTFSSMLCSFRRFRRFKYFLYHFLLLIVRFSLGSSLERIPHNHCEKLFPSLFLSFLSLCCFLTFRITLSSQKYGFLHFHSNKPLLESWLMIWFCWRCKLFKPAEQQFLVLSHWQCLHLHHRFMDHRHILSCEVFSILLGKLYYFLYCLRNPEQCTLQKDISSFRQMEVSCCQRGNSYKWNRWKGMAIRCWVDEACHRHCYQIQELTLSLGFCLFQWKLISFIFLCQLPLLFALCPLILIGFRNFHQPIHLQTDLRTNLQNPNLQSLPTHQHCALLPFSPHSCLLPLAC